MINKEIIFYWKVKCQHNLFGRVRWVKEKQKQFSEQLSVYGL